MNVEVFQCGPCKPHVHKQLLLISLQPSTAEHRLPQERTTLLGPLLSSSSAHRRSFECLRITGSEVVSRYAYPDAVSTLGLVCSSRQQLLHFKANKKILWHVILMLFILKSNGITIQSYKVTKSFSPTNDGALKFVSWKFFITRLLDGSEGTKLVVQFSQTT